jgi:hypothetical protein
VAHPSFDLPFRNTQQSCGTMTCDGVRQSPLCSVFSLTPARGRGRERYPLSAPEFLANSLISLLAATKEPY